MDSALLAVVIVQLFVLGGLLLGDLLTRRRELQLKLTDRRQELYQRYKAAEAALLRNTGGGRELTDDERETIASFSQNAALTASDEVVRALHAWQLFIRERKTGWAPMIPLAALTLAMRKDMGNPGTKLTTLDVARCFTDTDKWSELEQEFNRPR